MSENQKPNNSTSESERKLSSEEYKEAFKALDENFNIDAISRNFSDVQETADPYSAGISYTKETPTYTEFEQSGFYDFASGFYNSFVVGSAEGLANLLPTISNAIQETEFANNWIDSVSKFAEEFEYGYSDAHHKPIEEWDDINSSHFWAGLGNGVGFVAGIGKFAKAGQVLSKSARTIKAGEKALQGTSESFKTGAKIRNTLDEAVTNLFKKSKTAKLKRTPKFKEALKGKERTDMLNKLKKLEQTGKNSIKNSARIGSFFGGTTMMYGMVQEEALNAGLDRSDAARFALSVAGIVSLTEGAAFEWIGKIPAKYATKKIVKEAAKKSFKGMAGKSPKKMMEIFMPNYNMAMKGVALAEGASVEFVQEFLQTYIEEGAKQFYDVVLADSGAKVGKGKFGQEVFDLDADSFGGFFLDGENSTRTFTNSLFAGILGGIIGGGMAGLRLNANAGERNIGNESAFNLIADDVINKKTKNRDKINDSLTKAYNSGNISKADLKATNEILDEMEAFVTKQNTVRTVEDPVAQYQMFNLFKAGKSVTSKTKSKETIEKELQGELDKVVEERVKEQENKNSLLNLIADVIGINQNEIYYSEKPETKNPNEFNDKVLAYQYLATQVEGNAITTEEDVRAELDKIYNSEYRQEVESLQKKFKETIEKKEKRGDFLSEVEEEEFKEFEEDPNNVSDERISYLANKIKQGKESEFNEYEQKMHKALKDEVEARKQEIIKEEQEEEKAKEEAKKEKEKKEKEAKGEEYNDEDYKKYLSSLTEEEFEKEKEKVDQAREKGDSTIDKELAIINEEAVRSKKSKTPPSSKPPTGKTDEEIKAEKEEAEKKAKEEEAKKRAKEEQKKKEEAKKKEEEEKGEINNKTYTTKGEFKKAEAKAKKSNIEINKETILKAYENGSTTLKTYLTDNYTDIIKEAEEETTTDTTVEQKTGEDVEEETTPTKKKKIDLSGLTSPVDKDEVKNNNDSDDVNSGTDLNTDERTPEEIARDKQQKKKGEEATKNADENIDDINNLPEDDPFADDKEQRKGLILEVNDSQKISENVELFEKIKEHFKKMFPMIPVNVVNKLFNKYGVEILGKIAKDGVTISDSAYQNTLVHEFAHVYLDLIADKEIVENALEWIKTTQFFNKAKKAYPSFSTREQAMEALVQAMSENSIPKLEETLSNNELTRWGSIAKKLWRAIKRFFTGVNKRNYIDYLSDSLIYNTKPIMVETNYLDENGKEQRKAIGSDVAKFNNDFLIRKTKQFVINSLVNGDTNVTAVKVLSNLRSALITKMNSKDGFSTLALNSKYNELLESTLKDFDGGTYSELTDSKKISVLLEQTVYESGVSYLEHMASVTEELVKLPTEVKEDYIDEQINRDQNNEEETGKVEKENIKGDKKMTSSIASLIGTLVDSDGKKIHEDLVFSYLAKLAQSSVTNQEVFSKIKNDAKNNNKIASSLLSVLASAKQYDKAFKTEVYQTLLNEILSQQSIAYKSITIKSDDKKGSTVEVYNVSASRIKTNRTREFKRRMLDPRFISQIISRTGRDLSSGTAIDILEQVINKGKGNYINYKYGGTFDVQQVNAIAELLFGLDEGEFNAVQYIDWLVETENNKKRNKAGNLTIRAEQIDHVNNLSNLKAKQQAASNFFMVEVLNTLGEQLEKKVIKENKTDSIFYKRGMSGGAVKSLMDFASFQYDGDIHNSNMFINSSGNSISTTRLGSYLNRAFTNIAKNTEQAKKKENKKITVEGLDGRKKEVFLFANNPVFKKLQDDKNVKQFIDDAVNHIGEKVSEHSDQNEIDLLLTQLAYFAVNQTRGSYDQKLMINDRSHSNWLSVTRLDPKEADGVLLEQRNVDQALLNENYKLLDKQGKKKYLEEFNSISLNYAYAEKGKVKVIPFESKFIAKKFPSDFTKDQIKGFNKKLESIEKERKDILDTLEKTKLKKAFSKDHVGEGKLYSSLEKLITAFTINDRINRLAINDLVSEPIPYRLVKAKYNKKKGKTVYSVDPSNVIKRNSGFDSLGTSVNLSYQNTNKTVKTVVFEMKDDNGEDISNSFLFRGSQMTQEIQRQLGEKTLVKIGDNSKDGEYMINDEGRNIYHKNSSINSMENEEGENNLVAMAKASMGENYKDSRFYKMYEILKMLEEEYGKDHHIQIIDVEATKGSKMYETPSSIDNLYKNVKDKNWKAIDKSSYNYDSENFYIPFDENKKLSKKKLEFQEARFATQLVKILTNFTQSNVAKENSNELEQLMVELLEEQIGLKDNSRNYKDSTLGNVLFQTNAILTGLKDSIDQLQDPDTLQMLNEMISYNKREGKKLDKARKTIKKLTEIEEGLTKEQQKALTEAEDIVNNKKTINKIDHPAMLQQLKQVIISKIKSRGIDLRLPGAYLKMVPDIDNRLGDNEILLPWSMFAEVKQKKDETLAEATARAKEEAQKFLEEQNKKGGIFVPGVRVPASDAISTLNAKVVGLIDDANMAVTPHGFTVKSDADHDGDKVFIYRMDLQTKEGKTVVKEDSKKNKIYNLMNDLMQTDDYKKRIKDGTINLDVFEDEVKKIHDDLEKKTGKGLRQDYKFGSASEMSETDARLSFGEKAVGILAVAGKLNAALYQAGVSFKGDPKVTILGEKISLEDIDAPKTSNDIAMLLQAALDISKNPVLLTAGINASNINVAVAMLISGVKLDSVIKFINQERIVDFYKTDKTSNNSYNEKKNQDHLKDNLKGQIAKEENEDKKEELRSLLYFTELANELNTVTSIIQLDGKIPNDGYLLRDVKKAFNLIKNKESKTKLRYNSLADKPLNKHYEKLVDFALDTLAHHFITENENYYKEIKTIEQSRKYPGVKEFDMKTEKRRLDDMFALMIAQKLDIQEEISALEYGDPDALLTRLATEVMLSEKFKFSKVANTENILQKKYIQAQKELAPQDVDSQNEADYQLNMAFKSLSTKIDGFDVTFGELISDELEGAIWDENGKTSEGITKKKFIKNYLKSLESQGFKLPVVESMTNNLIDVAIKYNEYLDSSVSEMKLSKLNSQNKFLKLLQLAVETNPLTKEEERLLTGKNDIRYLTSTEKRLAKEDFVKLPLEIQKDFKAYQMLKYGLSNKLGSLISIMPNEFTVEYLKYISNIKSKGVKETKVYNLKDLELAENYNDLNYPLKKYKSANKLVDNEGNILKNLKDVKEGNVVFLKTELTRNNVKEYNLVKGAPGVRFQIDGDSNIYEFKQYNKDENIVSLIDKDSMAQKTKEYTTFRRESLSEASDEANNYEELCE